MGRFLRILRIIGLVLLILVLVLTAAGFWFVRRPWPQISGQVTVPGLSASSTVIRDTAGVPHIYAQNERDLFFAQGYVHAQDRLWQMHMNRMIGLGRLSEILGQRGVETDHFIRTLGWNRAAQKDWEVLDAETRALLTAYSDGVNAYIESHRGSLPLEFTFLGVSPQPWEPVDTLAWGKTITYSLGGNYRLELLRARMIATVGEEVTQELLPSYGKDMPIVIPPEAQGYTGFRGARFTRLEPVDAFFGAPGPVMGSNDWAVHGSRTATGKPIFANDTHLNLSIPSIWYANGLHGGRFDSIGFTFPGVPGVIAGHNQRIAWGVSNVNPDVQDLYLEKLDDPKQPTRYEFEGQWRDLEVITETIAIKGQAPEQLRVLLTNHGPIINDIIDSNPGITQPLTMRWTAMEGSTQMQSIVQINVASNWDEFRRALSLWDVPSQNFMYADVDGNIGYQTPGRIPIRPTKEQGMVPVPGWTGEYEWQGYIPFEELPHVLNPPSGFLAAANNQIAPDGYPHLLSHEWDPGYRAKRITDLLAADSSITVEDMRNIQADTYSLAAEALAPYLLAVQPDDPVQRQALDLVRAWDKFYEVDRVGGAIYQVWYWFLLKDTLSDDLGEDVGDEYLAGEYERHGTFQLPFMTKIMAQPTSHWFDDKATPEVEDRDAIVRRSLAGAVAWLRENYGDDPAQWTWGRLHTLSLQHRPLGASGIAPLEWAFNHPTIPARGDNFTVNAGSFRYSNPFVMVHGAAQRDIIDMSNLDRSLMIQTVGQSGHVFHPHYQDFIALWQNVEYRPMLSSREQIEANAEGTLTLSPP